MRITRIHIFLTAAAMIFFACEDREQPTGYDAISDEYRAIVYILPSCCSSPEWYREYGDRIYFYVYADLSEYADQIRADFLTISSVYNTIIVVLPADDTEQYFNNLKILDSLAADVGLNFIFAIFPKEKYGPEDTYLDAGTPMNSLVVQDIDSMAKLPQVWKVAVWYGWDYRLNPPDIPRFYGTIPRTKRDYYAMWLDEEYIPQMTEIAKMMPSDFLVITEWYQADSMCKISSIFPTQMVITGVSEASSPEEWLEYAEENFSAVCGNDRYMGIWIFWDRNDGAGENLSAYFPGYTPSLENPWE